MVYDIYTDGACSGNPGPGGYAFVVVINGKDTLKVHGAKEHTTNNCMELTAIVRALKHVINGDFIKFDRYQEIVFNQKFPNRSKMINIHSDSAYCVNAVNQNWITFWEANDWKTKQGNEVKNKELWIQLLEYIRHDKTEITFTKVKGHSGNKWNELVDKYAKKAIENLNAKALPSERSAK